MNIAKILGLDSNDYRHIFQHPINVIETCATLTKWGADRKTIEKKAKKFTGLNEKSQAYMTCKKQYKFFDNIMMALYIKEKLAYDFFLDYAQESYGKAVKSLSRSQFETAIGSLLVDRKQREVSDIYVALTRAYEDDLK